MKPIIGVTSKIKKNELGSYVSLKYTYINAIKESGGIPIIIPNDLNKEDTKMYIDILDGLILTGGGDVSPLLYNENPIKEIEDICQKRDETELLLLKASTEKNIPILGICRGMQLINVFLKGTLFQDIYVSKPDALGHVSKSTLEKGHHTINIKKDTFLYDVFKKEEIIVNSFHHQSIDKLGKGLTISATSTDGIIEAVEGNNIYAFQFHPEEMIKNKTFLKIFVNFINKCGGK